MVRTKLKLHCAVSWALLWTCSLHVGLVLADTRCLHGGTFDVVTNFCICTPDYYGQRCETSFAISDPCSNSSIPVLNDAGGLLSPSNNQSCSATGCIDFSDIDTDWYRLKSPAGSDLVSSCLQLDNACGSKRPQILIGLIQEATASRVLFSARLTEADRSGPLTCYQPGTSIFHTRILVCGSFKLYFLRHTYRKEQRYCIGGRSKCGPGLASADDSGHEPCYSAAACIPKILPGTAVTPLLRQVITYNRLRASSETTFECTIQEAFVKHYARGLLYRVMFRITYHDGKKIAIDSCTASEVVIHPGGSKTVPCPSDNLLLSGLNIAGGTLQCVVQAKCNSTAADYTAEEVHSLPHRFEITFNLTDEDASTGVSVITPSKPLKLCISTVKVPFMGEIYIRVTARRQALLAADAIKLTVSSPITNVSSANNSKEDPCALKVDGSVTKSVCTILKLHNMNEDGLIVPGQNSTKLAPMIEVNISYRSDDKSGGVYTAGNWIKVGSLDLTVDISALHTSTAQVVDPSARPNTTSNQSQSKSNATTKSDAAAPANPLVLCAGIALLVMLYFI